MLLGAAGLAVPAACGLPSGGHPIVDGPGPSAGVGSGETLPKAPTPDDATDPASLVQNFFAAAAGRLEDQESAEGRVKAYLTNSAQLNWQSSASGIITVVRLLNKPLKATNSANGHDVDVAFQPTGQLGTDGSVKPLPQGQGEARSLRFSVVSAGAGVRLGYLINQITPNDGGPPLSGLVLDSDQLDNKLFLPQLIYFWTTDRRGLVPDLRYVPRTAISKEIQYTEVVDWVLKGASGFLSDAVQGDLLNGNQIVGGNLIAPDKNGLVVNLQLQPPSKTSLDQVVEQLRWSLRPLYTGEVRLQINSQPQQVDVSPQDFSKANLAEKFSGGDDTVYCVGNGAVRPLDDPHNPPALLDPAFNKDVRFAALSPDLNHAALVIAPQGGQVQLLIGDGTGADKPRYVTAQLSGKVWTRPAFLPADTVRVLVAVDGRLRVVRPDGTVTEPHGAPESVDQFAMAPDGRRIGIISKRDAYVYSLAYAGDDDITFNDGERLINVGFEECTAIAWSLLERVLIAGRFGGTSLLAEATVDGAIVKVWDQQFASPIQSLVTITPAPSASSANFEWALIQSGNVAYQVRSNSSQQLTAFVTPATPSPSASGATQGAQTFGTPTYPFYLG